MTRLSEFSAEIFETLSDRNQNSMCDRQDSPGDSCVRKFEDQYDGEHDL